VYCVLAERDYHEYCREGIGTWFVWLAGLGGGRSWCAGLSKTPDCEAWTSKERELGGWVQDMVSIFGETSRCFEGKQYVIRSG